ncbi:MAG: hypothetical protein HEP71_11145 [Roseivirga sp.]|nr:hypothetical protein [Roseivirga sp.]
MDKIEESKIKEIILNLREQIKNGEVIFHGSDCFPLGCCGNASEILQKRLEISGFDQIELKSNLWLDNQSHSWLVYKGYVIDITIDQFESTKDLDFILKEQSSSFHKQFNPL